MSGDTVKQAVTVGAIAVGVGYFAGTLGTGPLASAIGSRFKMGAALSTFLASAGTTLVLSSVSRKFAPEFESPTLGTSIQQGTMVSVKEAEKPYRIVYGKQE